MLNLAVSLRLMLTLRLKPHQLQKYRQNDTYLRKKNYDYVNVYVSTEVELTIKRLCSKLFQCLNVRNENKQNMNEFSGFYLYSK